jgi:hypothetical protein
MVNKTIFVSIAAIDEIDLEQTLTSCFSQAKYPDNIHVGVLVQYQQYEEVNLSKFKNVSVVKLTSEEVLGVGATRQISSMLHNNQDYFLQIDAHMIFAKDWDELCVSYYDTLKLEYEKVILTGYAPNWYRSKFGEIVLEPFSIGGCSLSLVADKKSQQPVVGIVDLPIQIVLDKTVVEQKAVSYHFIFTEIDFVSSFLPDPFIIYNGDEATLSLRAFSRGYRFFMPSEAIVHHLNKQLDSFYSSEPRWQPMFLGLNPPRSNRELRANVDAYNRVKDIFTGKLLGYYGAPDAAGIAAYEKHVDLNFNDIYNSFI